MSTRWARLTRGFIAAAFSIFVAACSHAVAGGTTPSLVGLALCLAFSTVLCTLLAGKTLSAFRLSASIAVSQFAFHGAFSLLSDATATTGLGSMHHHPSGGVLAPVGSLAPAVHEAMTTDARMWLGHAVAAILTIVAFRYGEAAFWGLLDLTHLCIRGLVMSAQQFRPTLRPYPSVVAALRARLPRPVELVLSALRHRGPPAAMSI
jgi:hypothetical protein